MARRVLLTAASLADQPDFTIGDTEICPARRIVRGPGGTAKVEPRIMQVLITLAEAEGGVVTREALLDRCWGGVFVGDDSLNRAIAGVRRIASGIGGGSFEIETVPRTGYRLVSAGQVNSALGSASEHVPIAASFAARGIRRRLVIGSGLAAALATVGFWASRSNPDDRAKLLIEESKIAMRSGMPEGRREAVSLLEQAVALTPDNAEAWGALALTRARIDEHSVDKTTFNAAQIDREAHRALRLNGRNADAKSALALAIPYYGDWLTAERRFERILAEHPNHVFTRDARSFFLGAVGRMQEAARERLAISNDAMFDPELQYRHIYSPWFLGRIGEADRVASRGMEMWPGHPGIWFGKLWLLADTGRFDRAIIHIDGVQARPELPPPMFATLRAAMVVASSGRNAEAETVIAKIMAGVEQNVAAVVNALMLLNLLGATDRAFDLAQAYYLEQGPILAAMQWRPGQPVVPDQRRRKTNMLFAPTAATMQRDPRFPHLMERMGLTEYWDRRGVVPDFIERARA